MKITTAHRSGPAPGYESEDRSASHEDDTVNETTGGRWCWCRAWPRRAGVLAVTVGIVLLVAACGGGSSAGSGGSSNTGGSSDTGGSSAGSGSSSDTGGSTQAQQDLAFAQCMRSDGVTDFPDPNPSGQFGKISAQVEDNPHFGTGYNACKHLLPAGGENKAQQNLGQLLQFARCMRSHGVPAYPDPNPNAYSSISNTRINSLHLAGVNPNSPQVQAAVQTCERLHSLAPASRS
jgi:hypothetical protein